MPAAIKEFCDRNGRELVQYVPEQYELHCLLSRLNDEERLEFEVLRIGGDYFRCRRVLLTAEEFLVDRAVATDDRGQPLGFLAAAPAKEFLCRFLTCIETGQFDDGDCRGLSALWSRDPAGTATQVSRFWNPAREGGVILRAAEGNHWEPVRAAARQLRTVLRVSAISPVDSWIREHRRRMQRWRQPGGLLLACLGPDGSGKRRVISALNDRPLKPFCGVHTMHLRPGLLRQSTTREREPRRAQKPWGRFATVAKLMMFAADYWLGYWLRIRPKLVRSTLVVSDRYYDDVLVDPRRYRMARSRAFARALLPWIPRPGLWLVFDAPSRILKTRQPKVPVSEAARQRAEYRQVLRGHENVVVLDARQPFDKIVAQAERAIVSYLARRTAQRLGLPLHMTRNPRSTDILLFFCRRNVPVLSRLIRVLFNSDIYCRLPTDVYLPHPYGIVMHPQAVIGNRVTVMQQVTIGGKDRSESIAPMIGDDVYIGAGARVLGDVRIGHGAVIGANAVVTRDIPPGVTVVGANRIVTTPPRAVANGPHGASVTRLPISAQRGSRSPPR